MRLAKHFIIFCNKLNKYKSTGTGLLDYDTKISLKSDVLHNVKSLPHIRDNVLAVIT